MKIFVTGLGIIASTGKNTAEVLQSLIDCKSGIGEISLLETVCRSFLPAAEIKLTNHELSDLARLDSGKKYTRAALLGIIAAREAMLSAGIDTHQNARLGLISATSVGGMDLSEIFYTDFVKDKNKGRLRNIVNHECADSTERIADELGIKDFVTTVSTACSSSANAIMMGSRLIKNNILDIVIVGGTDPLTRFTLNGFNSLMIVDKKRCRPFDDQRNGMNLGEGAGYLVLESEKVLQSKNKQILSELSGYANTCDAYHQTASSPEGEGAYLAMKKAIELSDISPNDIDYINAHGTGTVNNDLSESKAMERIFGDKVPCFSSTKAYTGHTLGASGGIEAVISVMSICNNLVFPNLYFTNPMKEVNFKPVTELIKGKTIKHVLSNSFGFGGNNTSLVFSYV